MSANVPAELKYAPSHEWLRVQGGLGRIGVTDHAQHEMTDVVFVELPKVGRAVKAGEACAVVESVKTASDIYAPVSGEIAAVNSQLTQKPELVNAQPYGEGWLFEIKLSAPQETEKLLGADAYTKQISGAH